MTITNATPSSPPITKVMIIAGEASGDLLGAHLCRSMQSKNSALHFFGMGGPQMQEAGVEILLESQTIAVMGLYEICRQWSKIRTAFKVMRQAIQEKAPQLIILIDSPGFNLRMAKMAAQQGCPVFFYVSPQIWAWRYRRIKVIKKYVHHMAVLFDFEAPIYQKENIPVTFVGHPLIDTAIPTLNPEAAYRHFQLTPSQPIIALFPGSRHQEIDRAMPVIADTVILIKRILPGAQFILPLASSIQASDLTPWLSSDIKLTKANTYNALSIANAAIAVSGTVTLEIALQAVPLLIFYKLSPITFVIAQYLIRTPYIGLCNLILKKPIAREFIQQEASPKQLAEETIRLLTDQPYRHSIQQACKQLTHRLRRCEQSPSDRAAMAALALLAEAGSESAHNPQ